MRVFLLLCGISCSIIIGAEVAGQCRGGRCRVPDPASSPATSSAESYKWVPHEDWGQITLYRNNVQVGAYSEARGYMSYDARTGTWSKASAPVQVPTRLVKLTEPITQNFGVDVDKIDQDSPYKIKGKTASRQQVIEAIEKGLPEDQGKLRLTIIGGKADRDKVTAAWKTQEEALTSRCLEWSVEPTHWSLRESAGGAPMFKTDGKPTIYLTAADGEVLHRADDFKGVEDFGAIRKAIKDYDARKDPDLRKQPDKSASNISLLPLLLLFGGGAILFLKR